MDEQSIYSFTNSSKFFPKLKLAVVGLILLECLGIYPKLSPEKGKSSHKFIFGLLNNCSQTREIAV